MSNLFHYAFPVDDLEDTRKFYIAVLGCTEGRSSSIWVDFNFFGHQIVAHKVKLTEVANTSNPVDNDDVPVPHFGLILEMDEWERLADRLRSRGVEFVIEPKIRFKGEIGEQATMFLRDPSGNALEFKAFKDMSKVFAKD